MTTFNTMSGRIGVGAVLDLVGWGILLALGGYLSVDKLTCTECGATAVILDSDNHCLNKTRCMLRIKQTKRIQKKFLDKINNWLLDLGEPEAAAAVERVIWRRFNRPTWKDTVDMLENRIAAQ